MGLEPLNEPWQYTPIDTLKDFIKGYKIIKNNSLTKEIHYNDSFRY